jgi:hypothetical protein
MCAEVYAGQRFSELLGEGPLAARVLPIAGAVVLMTRCCAAELGYASESGLPAAGELDIDRHFGADAECARRLFSRASEICRNYPTLSSDGAATSAGKPGAFEKAWRQGAGYLANRLHRNIVEYLPPLVCEEGRIDEAADVLRLYRQVYPLALLSVLLRGWLEEPLDRAREMGLPEPPPIDFDRLFGPEATAAREDFEEFTAYLMEE